MRKDELDEAIKQLLKFKDHIERRDDLSAWVRVRCMTAGTIIMGAMWSLGGVVVDNFVPLRAAVEAFIRVKYGT